MKYLSIPLAFLFLSTLISSCDVSGVTLLSDNPDYLYSNSFEKKSDFTTWFGKAGELRQRKDSPRGEGYTSAYVSGAGCEMPQYAIEFKAPENAFIDLQVWGKNLSRSGSVRIWNKTTDKMLNIHVPDTTWTHYKTEDLLKVNQGDKIQLSMGAGGIVPSSILVASIKVGKLSQFTEW